MQFFIDNALLIAVAFMSGGMLLWPLFRARAAGPALTTLQATQLINGKHAQVVDVRDAGLLLPWDSFMRWLGYWVSALPFGLGFLWSIFDDDDRAWHDRWAKSVVVVVDSARTPPASA